MTTTTETELATVVIHLAAGGASVESALVVRRLKIFEDGAHVSEAALPPLPVAASGPLSLPGVLDTVTAAALADKAPLQAQIAQLTAELAAANAAIAAGDAAIAARDAAIASLQAQLDALTGPAPIAIKYLRIAMDMLSLADSLSNAVDSTIQTLAEDPDPKRIHAWWYDVQALNFAESEWQAIVVEMDKAGLWGKSSEADLIALARDIAAG